MVPSSVSAPTGSALAGVQIRSGQAARLAGVPVATLRVWERRYGAIDAPKTPTGQRLYASNDVQRLRLLKQLTSKGHAIGTIAKLPIAALQILAEDTQPAAAPGRQVVVVGRSAAQRLARFPACELKAAYDDLDQAEVALTVPEAAVWVIQLTTLQPDTARRVLALRTGSTAAALVVLYAFGAETVADSLRAAGATVRRDPVSGRELALLVNAAGLAGSSTLQRLSAPAAPRRFSDEALIELTELASTVACECPRHVAEIVMQLAGFERYSAECLSRSPDDAALHRQLSELAGSARALFEEALQRVVVEEGLQR